MDFTLHHWQLPFLCVQNTILSLWRWTRFRGQDQKVQTEREE